MSETLTDTQRALMALVMDGLTDKEIASARQRAVSTIKNEMVVIYERLGARNRANAVAIYGGLRCSSSESLLPW